MSPEPGHRRPTKQTRTVALVCIVVLVATTVLAPAAAQYREVTEREREVTSRTVSLIAPAVGERPDGTFVGVGMDMEVTVRNGTGGVFVDTRPLTQMDMQGSARLAAATASAIAGIDMGRYDFFVTTRAGSPVVGGPSAGAALTVAFTSLLLDVPLRDDVIMTGMVNPDGSVGPVGGILEKAHAAHDAGADLFLIPPGQSIVQQVIQETDDSGWFPTVRQRVEEVNVTQYADDQWGMRVVEVGDVYEAFEHATDARIERPEPPAAADSEAFVALMGDASRAQHTTASDELAALRTRLEDSGLAGNDSRTHGQLVALLDRAQEKLDAAGGAIDSGSPYTASSWVFQANIDLREVDYWLQTLAASDAGAALEALGETLSQGIDEASAAAASAEPRTVSTLEATGAAQERVLEARGLLTRAQAAHSERRLADAIDQLAFAEERRRSVHWWLELADELDRRDGGADLDADPERLATEYAAVAQQAVAYAEVLLGQTGTTETQDRLLGAAQTGLQDVGLAADEGLWVGALYLAMEAQVAAHAALSLVGSEALLEDRLERQRDRALLAVQQTRAFGAEPFLAVSYLDFAESLRADQPVDALLMFGNAATIAATSGALASGRECGLAGVLCDAGPPHLVRAARSDAPDPWTGFFALATIVLGFMAGILATLVVFSARSRRTAPATAGPVAASASLPPRPRPLPARLATGRTGGRSPDKSPPNSSASAWRSPDRFPRPLRRDNGPCPAQPSWTRRASAAAPGSCGS